MRYFVALLLAARLCAQEGASSRIADTDLTSTYRDVSNRLIGAALSDHSGYERLAFLCDRIGNRLSGSESLNRAIEWSAAQMRADGLANVATPPVTVKHWVRGHESLELLEPAKHTLPILGLGNSEGTGPQGITADVVVVDNFDQLDHLGRTGVAGKIVLFNAPFVSYRVTVKYRGDGPSRAAALGAVAVLVRSVASATLRTPHTGALSYKDDAPKIPAAAVTIEDAMMMRRMADRGERIRVHLHMDAHFEAPAQSANVMGEIVGREKPDEVVVLGGHIDSWDVGQGAQDDGSGALAALTAVKLIHQLGLHPRRTIRVVFWTNEENGVAGGKAYRQMLGEQVSKHVAAIEMDGGSERPLGFDTTVREEASLSRLHQIGRLLDLVDATTIQQGGSEADIEPTVEAGVPGLGLRTVMQHYFDWHHTEADTVDKVDPEQFRKNVACLAVMAYVLADMPERLQP